MSVRYQNLKFDWLGHAGLRVESDEGKVIYIDPWSETFNDKPRDADIAFITHDDFDHYDPVGIDAVSRDDTRVVLYEGVDSGDLDMETESLGYEDEKKVMDISVNVLPAYNLTEGNHVDEDGSPFHEKGEGAGYLLEIEDVSMFIAGDTDFLEEHKEISPDVLILPIGGYYTMDSEEALDFVKSVKPKLVLPIHYDTFEKIKADENKFVKKVRELGISAEIL